MYYLYFLQYIPGSRSTDAIDHNPIDVLQVHTQSNIKVDDTSQFAEIISAKNIKYICKRCAEAQ